eukprot:COSAG02_NODE_10186_length_1999_cov_0.885789_2_plen_288_part_01
MSRRLYKERDFYLCRYAALPDNPDDSETRLCRSRLLYLKKKINDVADLLPTEEPPISHEENHDSDSNDDLESQARLEEVKRTKKVYTVRSLGGHTNWLSYLKNTDWHCYIYVMERVLAPMWPSLEEWAAEHQDQFEAFVTQKAVMERIVPRLQFPDACDWEGYMMDFASRYDPSGTLETPRLYILYLRIQHDCPVSTPPEVDANGNRLWYGEYYPRLEDRHTPMGFGMKTRRQIHEDQFKRQHMTNAAGFMNERIRKDKLRRYLMDNEFFVPKRATLAQMRAILGPRI